MTTDTPTAPTPLWWVSWWQPGDDYRPTGWPPPAPVLAYWCSGERGDDDNIESSLVALVEAPDEDAAWAAILNPAAWPEAGERRFCNERDRVSPPSDRFRAPKWSVETGRWPWAAEAPPRA